MEVYVCTMCGYQYNPAEGVSEDDIPPGLPFEEIPEDWICPVCGAPKDMFEILGD